MTKVVMNDPSRSLLNLQACTPEDVLNNWRAIEDLFALLGYPSQPADPTEEGAVPTSFSGMRMAFFTLTAAFTGSSSPDAQVLALDASTITGEVMDAYDPLSLWSGAAGTENGIGFIANHPFSGEQVVVPLTLGGVGASDGNDKVKANSSGTADFLANVLTSSLGTIPGGNQQVTFDVVEDSGQWYVFAYTSSVGGGADTYKVKVNGSDSTEEFLEAKFENQDTYNASNHQVVSHETRDASGVKSLFLFTNKNTDEKVKVDTDQTAGSLEDQFDSSDLSGTIPGGTQQVLFGKTGTSPNKKLYAYTATGGGGGSTVRGCRPNAGSIAEGGSGACDLMTWSGSDWADAGSDGTLFNLTGRTLLNSIAVPAVLVTGTTYVAVDNKAASLVVATAVGHSNTDTSFTEIEASGVVGWNGEDSGISISAGNLHNPAQLEVYNDDIIIASGDYNGTAGKWVIVAVMPRVAYGKFGVTTETITARSGTTAGEGTVDVYELDTTDGSLDDKTTPNETWYNLADETIDSGKWVMAKPVLTKQRTIAYFIDWEQCG